MRKSKKNLTKRLRMYFFRWSVLYVFLQASGGVLHAQHAIWDKLQQQPMTLGVDQGSRTFTVSPFKLDSSHTSHTLSALTLGDDPHFDHTPDEPVSKRDRDGFFRLGDINLSIRRIGTSEWVHFSSAEQRRPVK